MTPEEKAKDLIAHFNHYAGNAKFGICKQCQSVGMRHCAHADTCGNNIVRTVDKQCALICCDEIIAAIDFDWMEVQNLERGRAYWQAVKQHIANQ